MNEQLEREVRSRLGRTRDVYQVEIQGPNKADEYDVFVSYWDNGDEREVQLYVYEGDATAGHIAELVEDDIEARVLEEDYRREQAAANKARDDRYAHALEVVSELSTSETEDLLSMLLESRARETVNLRMLDVAFRLSDGEVTPQTVCMAAIAARDYCAEFGQYPDELLPASSNQAFDDWIADLAEKALGISIDPTTRFRQGDV